LTRALDSCAPSGKKIGGEILSVIAQSCARNLEELEITNPPSDLHDYKVSSAVQHPTAYDVILQTSRIVR
jgi:hypothetical protein